MLEASRELFIISFAPGCIVSTSDWLIRMFLFQLFYSVVWQGIWLLSLNNPSLIVAVEICSSFLGLSGGERSFTTACFIMALWEIMEAPFRCMDEFDVFMDMINRRVSAASSTCSCF